MTQCKKCGKISYNVKFCPDCGKKLPEEQILQGPSAIMAVGIFLLCLAFAVAVIIVMINYHPSEPIIPEPTIPPVLKPIFHVSQPSCQDHWSFSNGCYYVCSVTVYNTGNAGASATVTINAEQNGVLIDTAQQTTNYISVGGSDTIEAQLDIDCDKSTYFTTFVKEF